MASLNMASGSFNYSLQPGGKRRRCISYDLYVDTVLKEAVTDDVAKLGPFRLKNKFVVQASVGSSYGQYQLKGHLLTRVRYRLLSEIAKRAILSLIKPVVELIASGKCLDWFNCSQIVFTPDGKVLLKHVRIIDGSSRAKGDTINDTVDVIEKFFVKRKSIPVDLVHLLNLMDSQRKVSLYSIHSSLLPLTNRGWAYLQMHEFVKEKISQAQRESILLKLPYHDNWRVQVRKNLVLLETYNFVLGSYDSRPGIKSDKEEQLESAELFLDFLRNGTSHRMQRSLITIAYQFDLIVFVMFPLLLPRLQEAILDVMQDEGLKFLKSRFEPLMLSD